MSRFPTDRVALCRPARVCSTWPKRSRRGLRRRPSPASWMGMVDLAFPLETDASVRILTPDSPESLHVYRHSTAHLLAAAVTNLFPEVQCGIGPATEEG